MRLDINLASQPYEDARQFWMRWGTGLAAAVMLTLALVTITISGWFAARRDHRKISELRTQIAQRDHPAGCRGFSESSGESHHAR